MKTKKIGTHDDYFHADDVFAYAILLMLHGVLELFRTRETAVLSKLDIVFDVGGGVYDHHQNEKEFRDGVPYAAFGLIWRDFGKELLEKKLPQRDLGGLESIDEIHRQIDLKFVQGVDALDNGVELKKDQLLTTVSELISKFNPIEGSKLSEDDAFLRAANFACTVLDNEIAHQVSMYKAKKIVQDAVAQRTCKEVAVLPKGLPWHETLMEADAAKEILYVVFPVKNGDYRIQVVPLQLGEYAARKGLPQSWAGKNGDELGAIIGIDDAIFCHSARFIAGAKSMESIMKMAALAVAE